ncbi:peptidase [Vagococcus sp. BWB3-3]|uniref:Peptidase n=1 Tax=Vagococcus allomyrinae TaxID=2794353 RepID=A0A940ST29_9ENTE|nr:PepSY domain-containing protein [Vagococcus allomyrinae]MBP1039870.1 peptidase [Vagococcus allomyrinae]
MFEDEKYDYLGAGLLAGLIVGTIGGAIGTIWYKKNKTMNADVILESVKSAFLKEGPIEGSWIEFSKQPLQKFAIKSKTYTGGITRLEDLEMVQYEFVADAYTGTVLDIYRL